MRLNSGAELGFFLLSLKISLFGCNVARAFSHACSFVLFLVHIWHKIGVLKSPALFQGKELQVTRFQVHVLHVLTTTRAYNNERTTHFLFLLKKPFVPIQLHDSSPLFTLQGEQDGIIAFVLKLLIWCAQMDAEFFPTEFHFQPFQGGSLIVLSSLHFTVQFVAYVFKV